MKLLAAAAALPFLVSSASSRKTSAWQYGRDGPVDKVVKLLDELKSNIAADGENEQKIYDKYACWCEETTKRKADTITEARDSIRALGQSILSLKGKAATLKAEIDKLLVDIKANEEAQAEATSIRQKENEAWQAETAEMKQALGALEKAITVLKGATGAALLQQNRESEEVAHEAARRLEAVLDAVPVVSQRVAKLPAKLALLKNAASALAGGKRSQYAPQSGTIQGILSDMYATFGSDLQSKTSEEASANRKFEDFMNTKQEELETMQASVKKKTAEKAEAEVMLSEAIQSYDDTERQMKADIEFFDITKEACGNKAEEWGERKELRKLELEGIEKALEILTSDEAKALFDSAIKPGVATPALLQVNSAGSPQRKAFEALKKSASKSHSLRLARLAASVATAKVGHFDEVLKAIDDLITVLHDEQKADTEKREACKEEYQTIASQLAEVEWLIEKNEAKIKELETEIEEAEAEKTKTEKEIEDVKKQMEDMTTERTAENEAFLHAKQEDEDAIKLLTEAKDAVAAYYKDHGKKKSLLQQGPEFEVSKDQAPDAKFSNKGSREGEAKGVVALLASVIEDLGNEIKQAQQEEESAQMSYEKAMAAAKKLQEELEAKVIHLEDVIATKKEEKLAEEELKTTNENNKTDTEDHKAKIKPDCDWMLEEYEKRMAQRTAEVEGLKQAKDFLAGYQPPAEDAFVQRAGSARRPALRAHAVRA
eukprot:TRINITY_DN101337_c0_g1_i1.p1 TRINITY_DN101337_c0_g1~~TRINITY_DN101337_c0_g1_i1.p1  ORF type:complete len:717 (+),score=265.95 TRINITY_DN101337_c0_g1_i1:62-2212(+)